MFHVSPKFFFMETFLFLAFIFLAISHLSLILFLLKFRKTLKLLLKKLSTYDQLQDADISVLKERLDVFEKRLMSLFLK